MEWSVLQILLKVPKKKYIKKLVEYAAALRHCQQAIPSQANTPIGEQFPHDLQITAQQTHSLIHTLVRLIRESEKVDFESGKIQEMLNCHIDEGLCQILVDILSRMREDLRAQANNAVGQASKLIGFDWQLDMEVANEKGKTSLPVVDLELTTLQENKLGHTLIQMKGPQFTVFFKNLQKIKEQLSQLVQSE